MCVCVCVHVHAACLCARSSTAYLNGGNDVLKAGAVSGGKEHRVQVKHL